MKTERVEWEVQWVNDLGIGKFVALRDNLEKARQERAFIYPDIKTCIIKRTIIEEVVE